MQNAETHSLRTDAKFILASAEVLSRPKPGSLSNHSHLLAVFFLKQLFLPFQRQGVVQSVSSLQLYCGDKTASISNIHFISFVQYERVRQKC